MRPECTIHGQREVFDEDEDKLPHLARGSAGGSLVVATFAIAHTANAQRARLGKVTSLQATLDKSGPHPATAAITGPATLTCLNAVSEVPNSNPAPSCHVVGPGFNTDLEIGHTAKLTGAGNVTLTCNGQGPMLRCSARIDIPPPSH